MFTKESIEQLFAELRRSYYRSPDWEYLNRQAHLGIASNDSGGSLNGIDARVVALIKEYRSLPE
ncbi:hypothetical protein FIM12_08050 [SAR202 cluster bacterium AD-804-J14_MRT_500m]|nr:hypothetical protein [SAR202 cluster bacterium AD-804-J14_MRT_500m]